ncbi:hypothetical protein M9H77_07710 [Catharanthus roseus]|uniref:Uncharacterized protein n=1 Tax=Catharanthus roseus TaxID=4058 RepID=A0ACC0BVP1_CATRO|nr:hypothetical protein M9H77_07710 [Catharanthus roseus]
MTRNFLNLPIQEFKSNSKSYQSLEVLTIHQVGVAWVLGVEDRRSMQKELSPILGDITISLSLNLSSLCYELTFHRTKEAPVKSQSLHSLKAKDLVDEGKMDKKRPSHSKIKSLETLKALSMLEWN